MQLPEFRNEPFTDFSRPENRTAFAAALAQIEKGLGKHRPCWIAGEAVTDRPGRVERRDPGDTDRLIATFPQCNVEDAERAVQAAHAAFAAWSQVPATERVRIHVEAARRMRERKHLFSALLVYEAGKSWVEADCDTAEAIDFLEYYARHMLRLAGPQPITPHPVEKNEMVYIPLGVGAVIPPWNFPLAIMVGMTSAALVTGNTVVLKPAEPTPTIAAMFVELMYEVGVPKPALNFITGPGRIVGEHVVNHRLTRFISFTGSKEVGLHLFERSAKVQPGQIWMKRLVAEMGGKDSILVDKDCNLDAAVEAVVASAFGYQGQKCSACSRAVVHTAVYDEFLRRMLPKVQAIRVGHPRSPETYMGPVINEASAKKILEYIDVGKKEGRLLAGGGRAEGKGHYIQPTVFADVAPTARLSQEEIFGPVLAVIRVKDFEEGLQVVNNTEYGLTGSVYTDVPAHKAEARRRFHVGNLYINRKCTGALVGVHPFGGFNMSGTDSKAGGPDYLLLFLQAKSISEKPL
ncbi:MAG: L-glutamate gamma-semialdehyde dehydrogenase [Planctomycetes bacterium]|nr:L-glutamate gamma-semialdehyde dehydrogenase [Planctomycetota bacterium]